jgi:hypothetical protein
MYNIKTKFVCDLSNGFSVDSTGVGGGFEHALRQKRSSMSGLSLSIALGTSSDSVSLAIHGFNQQ